MPLYGTRPLAPLIARAPVLPNFGTEPWDLPKAGILQLMYEIRQEAMVNLLPPALHPTIPPTLVFTVSSFPESSIGPFTLAEVRVGCRAGGRPRGFVARCYTDSEKAADELRSRWGYNVEVADVRLRTGYDRHQGTVVLGGKKVLDITLQDPEPISGSDIQYLPAVHLARVQREGGEVARIIQVDPDYVFHKADRGRPLLTTLDQEAFFVEGADAWWPVSASYAVADVAMPKIRYVLDPEKPAVQGVEQVG
jgi:Acetoacetate decarboxylase (ADC)